MSDGLLLTESTSKESVQRHARLLGRALRVPFSEVEEGLTRLLERHAAEWRSFVGARSPNSFIRRIARHHS